MNSQLVAQQEGKKFLRLRFLSKPNSWKSSGDESSKYQSFNSKLSESLLGIANMSLKVAQVTFPHAEVNDFLPKFTILCRSLKDLSVTQSKRNLARRSVRLFRTRNLTMYPQKTATIFPQGWSENWANWSLEDKTGWKNALQNFRLSTPGRFYNSIWRQRIRRGKWISKWSLTEFHKI